MSLGTVLLIVLILILIGVLPHLAARSKLGLASQWNRRSRTDNPHCPDFDGAPVISRGDARIIHSDENSMANIAPNWYRSPEHLRYEFHPGSRSNRRH